MDNLHEVGHFDRGTLKPSGGGGGGLIHRYKINKLNTMNFTCIDPIAKHNRQSSENVQCNFIKYK